MVISFGIPKLDELFGRLSDGEYGMSTSEGESISICIVGADGTGKSVLALHLASRYASKCDKPVFYFSEDLGYERAKGTFEAFGLDQPMERCKELQICMPTSGTIAEKVEFSKGAIAPSSVPDDADANGDRSVKFFDLQASRTGDHSEDSTISDHWSSLLEIVAREPKGTEGDLAFAVVDNVDALQMIHAGVDQFGEERSRWNRLDQLLSLARGRCHLVLISGEPDPGHHLDEQYAVDYVLHLHVKDQGGGYMTRVLEVEKARGQVNVGGPHAFSFRNGKGTTTGYQDNPDCPQVFLNDKPLAHLRVVHSLDYIYSRYESTDFQGYVPGADTGLGFNQLDPINELLPGRVLHGGTATAIVGPRQTYKGYFVSALEASALKKKVLVLPEDIKRLANEVVDPRSYKAYRDASDAFIKANHASGSVIPVVVHLTTVDVESWQVAHRIARWTSEEENAKFEAKYGTLGAYNKGELAAIEARLICRRLEIHANSPALLFELIRECVNAGIELATGSPGDELIRRNADALGQVVVTLGDWAQIEERHPVVAADTKFLPLLIFHLRRQGVTVLVTETRSESGTLPSIHHSNSRLVQDVDQAIFTWRALGDARVAVAVVPQEPRDGRTLVREVRNCPNKPGLIYIDPSLERYHGFETGNPTPVKLHLKLLGQTPAQQIYAREMARLLEELSEESETGSPLVEATDELEYELLRDVVYLLGDARHPYTQLVMVDEFWEAGNSLHTLKDYMDGIPGDERMRRMIVQKGSRSQMFNEAFKDLGELANNDPFMISGRKDRVPYTWNFGMILTRPDAWRKAYEYQLPHLKKCVSDDDTPIEGASYLRAVSEIIRFGVRREVGYALDPSRSKKPGPYGREGYPRFIEGINNSKGRNGKPLLHDMLGWRVFLEACCVVAKQSADLGIRPFDIDLTAPEALGSTVLEIWLSELKGLRKRAKLADKKPKPIDTLLNPTGERSGAGLPEMAQDGWGRLALYTALRLLAEVFTPDMLESARGGFDIAPRRPVAAAAVRHGYATAVRAAKEDSVSAYTPIRLPGHYTTRGDWHLAVAEGSKSMRLAHDALDLLSSPRANFERLQNGVGLPTRHLPAPDYIRTALATIAGPTAQPNMTYKNLLTLGEDKSADFRWLFRIDV